LFAHFKTLSEPAYASSSGPSIEQQIDIQSSSLSTTSTSYTDTNGSGSFSWDSKRYSSLQHVNFEAGIAKNGATNTTRRTRSGDILASLIDGNTYKVRIQYSCTYNSGSNTFTEIGYAALWTSDNVTKVPGSEVSSTINTGNGICPTSPTSTSINFSRLIILQANPNSITDTDTYINIGHTENQSLLDTNDHALASPKIWMYTARSLHPNTGWDGIRDVTFSATLASPNSTTVSACLFDIDSNQEVACVSTSNTTPTYVTSPDIQSLLHDRHQYETYLKVGASNNSVVLYNSYVTVQQSATTGLTAMELYHDYNSYPITSSSKSSYGRGYFMNLWEPANFNIGSGEVLSFSTETTQRISTSTAIASSALYTTCAPLVGCGSPVVELGSFMNTPNTNFTRVRTTTNAFAMPDANDLDIGTEVASGNGTLTNSTMWLVIDVNMYPTYPVQVTTNVAYGPMNSELLDQCVPVGAPTGRPGIIMIHGGGWHGGDKSYYSNLCSAYAAQGFVATTINYRLVPSFVWPSQMGDIQLAVRYMRANAGTTGLDTTKICSLGDSAGAQLALLLDTVQTIHPTDVSSISANLSPTVGCAVDQYGPSDFVTWYNEAAAMNNTSITGLIAPLFNNQTPQSNPGIYTDASPVTYISPQTGPVLIIHGSHDDLVFPEQATELQLALQQAGTPVQYMPNYGYHAYGHMTPGQINMILDQADAFIISTELTSSNNPPPPPPPAPTITNIQSSNTTSSSTTVTWTTDVFSDSQVEYGLTTSYGSSTTVNGSLVTSHSAGLSALSASTTYHYRVKSSNNTGQAVSGDFTFTTSNPPPPPPPPPAPTISNVQTSSITASSTTATWTTDVTSDSQVEYGLTASYGSSTFIDSNLVTSHSTGINGLSASTLYHYRVKSSNSSGQTVSGDFTFTTANPPPPPGTGGLVSGQIATNSGAGINTIATTLGGVSTNNRLVVLLWVHNTSPISVKDQLGNVFHQDLIKTDAGSNSFSIYSFSELVAGSYTITASWSGNQGVVMSVAEYQGLGTAFNDVDAAGTQTGSSITPNVTSTAVTSTNELAILGGAFDANESGTTSNTTGLTLENNNHTTSGTIGLFDNSPSNIANNATYTASIKGLGWERETLNLIVYK
jgi:acetyl esterase/lipase